jgi:hypothetical protein
VSKPCCPVCSKLLINPAGPFIFRGSHQTFSACTLPKWAPESVANDAINYYKSLLREALEDLMETSAALRSRTKSMQSDRLSLDSHENETQTFAKEGYKVLQVPNDILQLIGV